jgi:arylsulfatase
MSKPKTTRRDFLNKLCVGSAALAAGAVPDIWPGADAKGKEKGERPNILFICTDYQAGEDGPSLGSPFLDMPALDNLCRKGVVFTRYYSTAPICMPARCTWYTGQYPHTHGMWGNDKQWIPENSPILMKELGKSGYFTMGIGKMHFNPPNRTEGFHRLILADRKGNIESDKDFVDDYGRFLTRYGLTRWDYLKLQYESDPPHVYDWPFSPELHIDRYVGAQAQQAISKGSLDGKAPWFLWVSFNGPHNPWDPPAEYSRPYLKMDLPAPRTYPGELGVKPTANTRARYDYTKEVPDYIDRYPEREESYIRRIRAGHYGNLTLIDRQVQGILDALEEKGLLESTVIVYSADHGSLLGDHGGFHKALIYERSARIPFIVHCPARFQARRTEALAGNVDLMPTILSLAGAPIPAAVEGKDLTPLLSGQRSSIQDRVFIEISHNVGIIKDRWKMFAYPNGEIELYDLQSDSGELKNVYNEPAYRAIGEELKRDLVAFRADNAKIFTSVPPKPPDVQREYRFKQGDVLKQNAAPFPPPQGGRSISVQARIGPVSGSAADGAIFVCEESIPAWPGRPLQNGYALYLKEGRLAMEVRLWDQETVIAASEAIPAGECEVTGGWDKNGNITLKVNDRKVAEGKVPSGLPERRGRREVVAPSIYVGIGRQWPAPIGDDKINADFQGTINQVVLHLE